MQPWHRVRYGKVTEPHDHPVAGLDWRQAVLHRFLTDPALAVARLKADRTLLSEAARVRAFVQAGAGCRATYYHHTKKPLPPAAVPKLALSRTAPLAEAASTLEHLERLRWRFGQLGNG